MGVHRLKSSAGFTLIAALAAVVIIGIMAGTAAQSWTTFMKREREEELIFRGTQYMNAIKKWYNPNLKTPKNQPSMTLQPTNVRPLKRLDDLLSDPNSPNPTPLIRKLYKDPMTNKDFVAILDANQAIIGVRSPSEDEPIKKGNFSDELQGLNDKKSYREWEFIYRTVPISRATGTGATGLPTVPQVPPVPPVSGG
jgi:type II secretory pathway pseudopilin PulG